MGEEEPESKDGLCKDIKDSVSDDLGVNVDVTGSIGNTPDAMTCQSLATPEYACRLTLGR